MKEINARGPARGNVRYQIYKVMVDDEDYEWLSKYRWILLDGYAVTKQGKSYVRMHRMIMNASVGENIYIDHIDNNPLNNQRSNLRRADRFQNQQNRKTNKGNTLPKGIRLLPSGKYNVRIQAFGKRVVVGTFDTLEEAVEERNRVAGHQHGEFMNPSYISENGRYK